ncbi:PR-1-like protein [Linnemannia elongata AG-77]|uniref:PR-1-like protein n=1 Tax=Linnemannia elongata AG-77 TaxID=1314771 RepID=A0A197JXW8_9FUNG|nr:PR-1-like protein [Linnemannia elongata AG-77]
MVAVNPLVLLVIYCIAHFATGASYCPNSSLIFDIGILPGQEVLNSHNRLRRLLNVPPLVWDEALARKAQNALLICDMQRELVTDDRWPWVGGNTYFLYTPVPWSTGFNITEVVQAWSNECQDYIYGSEFSYETDYTQLMWAKSTHVGCAGISYYRPDPYFPTLNYVKSYYCAYGPGGNGVGELPYVANFRLAPGFCHQPISV